MWIASHVIHVLNRGPSIYLIHVIYDFCTCIPTVSNPFLCSQNNIAMLLEINYRERLHMVTNEVKRRLDYQIALQDLHRRMEKEHMINWVEKSVIGSISPQQVCVTRRQVLRLLPPAFTVCVPWRFFRTSCVFCFPGERKHYQVHRRPEGSGQNHSGHHGLKGGTPPPAPRSKTTPPLFFTE